MKIAPNDIYALLDLRITYLKNGIAGLKNTAYASGECYKSVAHITGIGLNIKSTLMEIEKLTDTIIGFKSGAINLNEIVL